MGWDPITWRSDFHQEHLPTHQVQPAVLLRVAIPKGGQENSNKKLGLLRYGTHPLESSCGQDVSGPYLLETALFRDAFDRVAAL